MRPHALLTTALLAGSLLASAPALAAGEPAPSALDLVNRSMQAFGHTTFVGHKVQALTRQALHLNAAMRVYFQDAHDYRVLVTDPGPLAGVHLWLDHDKANVYFPGTSLLFQNDNPSGSLEAAETIFGRITEDSALLAANYDLKLLPAQDVAMVPCWVVDIVPRRGYSTPGRRFWIAKDTAVVMREQRFWGADQPTYFDSYYDEFVPARQVDLGVSLPEELHKIEMRQTQSNSFVGYRSVDEARRATGLDVTLPRYVPAGFRLNSIQFANLFGARITMLHYTDGLNWAYITYRPRPNMFLTLMAGSYAVGLIDKFNELSFQAPYNYASAEKANQKLYAYGDLYPDELQRMLDSLPLKPLPS